MSTITKDLRFHRQAITIHAGKRTLAAWVFGDMAVYKNCRKRWITYDTVCDFLVGSDRTLKEARQFARKFMLGKLRLTHGNLTTDKG